MRIAILALTAALFVAVTLGASGAQAAVVGAGATGFQVEHSLRVAAPPARVWEAIVTPGRWWNPEHSYSKNAGNMTIAPVAGGCWCEKWPTGSAVHMTVVQAVPGRMLRMQGGLGPMQAMAVNGVMTWTLTGTVDGGTDVKLDYAAGGYSASGFDGLSRGVDGVLAEQMNRLQMFIQTGHPNAQATQ